MQYLHFIMYILFTFKLLLLFLIRMYSYTCFLKFFQYKLFNKITKKHFFDFFTLISKIR